MLQRLPIEALQITDADDFATVPVYETLRQVLIDAGAHYRL